MNESKMCNKCWGSNTYLNSFNTFEFWYCRVCKDEISEAKKEDTSFDFGLNKEKSGVTIDAIQPNVQTSGFCGDFNCTDCRIS